MTYAYLRISTSKQDNDKQEHLVLEYAHKNKILIDEILRVEMSSRKSEEARRITELKEKLCEGDLLITAELSRLGRSMLEVMNLVLELSNKGVKLAFVRQPELSTFNNAFEKLILAVYAYSAETEREFLSMRTKQGLEAAKAKGKMLGRPKGSTTKSIWDSKEKEIIELVNKGVTLRSIWKIIEIGSYQGFFHYCHYKNKKIKEALRVMKDTDSSLIAIINQKEKNAQK